MSPDRPKPTPVPGSTSESGGGIRERIARLQENPANLLKEYPHLPFPEQMQLFLFAPAELRRELLLVSSHAKQLVSHLPVQEAYLTLKEIGASDAIPLLAHMTPEQILYWNDLDTWDKDDFRPETLIRLLELMQQCGQDRLAEWVGTLDPETLVLLLCAFGQVTKLDIFQEPAEEDDLPPYQSVDGYYRYHFLDDRVRPHIEAILRILHARDPQRYGMILESAYQDMPSEVQEEALRFRNGRLSDQGIPDFEESMEIYRPLSDDDFQFRLQTVPPRSENREPFSVVYPVRWLPPDSMLRKALRSLAGQPEADTLRMELASLGNKVVVADGMEANNPHYVKAALQKVSGYLTIGLEHLGCRDEKAAASWMRKSWLIFLFRLGYSRVHRLRETAVSLLDRTQFRWAGRALSLAGPPFEETLWGLTRPRPLFFQGDHPDTFLGFRDFQCMEDIRTAEHRLTAIALLAGFFSGRDLSPEAIKVTCLEGGWGDRADLIRWSSVLQTLRVNQLIADSEAFRLLHPEEVRRFMEAFFQDDPDGSGRRVDPAYTSGIIRWVEHETGGAGSPANRILTEWIRSCIHQLEQELGGLKPDQVPDPRYVESLCLRQLPSEET